MFDLTKRKISPKSAHAYGIFDISYVDEVEAALFTSSLILQ